MLPGLSNLIYLKSGVEKNVSVCWFLQKQSIKKNNDRLIFSVLVYNFTAMNLSTENVENTDFCHFWKMYISIIKTTTIIIMHSST